MSTQKKLVYYDANHPKLIKLIKWMRHEWNVNDQVMIYSISNRRWCQGVVTHILENLNSNINDSCYVIDYFKERPPILQIKYCIHGVYFHKRVHRYHWLIKPVKYKVINYLKAESKQKVYIDFY